MGFTYSGNFTTTRDPLNLNTYVQMNSTAFQEKYDQYNWHSYIYVEDFNFDVVLNGTKIDTKRRKFGAVIGDNVQTGINSTINVGTIIGNNCFIGQTASVTGEVRPNSKIL